MKRAGTGDRVQVHYRGTLADGTVFDSSKDREPLEFTVGDGALLPAFESAVVGLATGESATAVLAATDAYGAYNTELITEVTRDRLPAGMEPKIGDRLQAGSPDGDTLTVMITAVADDKVTVDANHPLAGEDLTFEIELLAVL